MNRGERARLDPQLMGLISRAAPRANFLFFEYIKEKGSIASKFFEKINKTSPKINLYSWARAQTS